MAKNRRFPYGRNIPIAATHPASPKSGQPVRLGHLVGVAEINELADGSITADFGPAVYELSVRGVNTSGNSAVAVGDALYYVDADVGDGSGFLSKKDTGRFAGTALATVASGTTSKISVMIGRGEGAVTSTTVQQTIPAGFVKVNLVNGGAVGNFNVTGIGPGDELVFVGRYSTAAEIATLTDVTSQFSITGANTINNAGGTVTTGDLLQVIWLNRV